MSTKNTRNRYSHRRFQTNHNNRHRPDNRATKQTPDQVFEKKRDFLLKEKIP